MSFFKKKIARVKKAPTKSGATIPLHISKMTLKQVRWWQAEIQPVIDELPNRADKYWNWVLIAASTNVIGRLFTRKPTGISIGIKIGQNFVPVALLQLVSKFPYLKNPEQKSAFIWYLSVAPKEALLQLEGIEIKEDLLPKRLGSIALDTAVVYAMNHRYKGRTALHADEEGGDQLLDWYIARGMQIFPKNDDLDIGIRSIIVPNDGRYCYYSEEGAREEIKEFNPLRS